MAKGATILLINLLTSGAGGLLRFAAACLVFVCPVGAQDELSNESQATFGTTVVIPGGLTGKIYELPEGTGHLPNLTKLEPVGTIYTKALWVPAREFKEGFPGVTTRIEWFAIDFSGRFYVNEPGAYRFAIRSDDGSKLYIDGKLHIDADRLGWNEGQASVKLDGGVHTLRVSYFQGPRYHLFLMLMVQGPRDKALRPFNTDNFQPPSDPALWKYGSPEAPPTPEADPKRRNLIDSVIGPIPLVPLSVRVTSQGRTITGLAAADFVVRNNGQPQPVLSAAFDNQALDAMLLIDDAPELGGMRAELRNSAPGAIARLRPEDRVGVVEFGEKQLERLNPAPNREILFATLAKIEPLTGAKELNTAIALTAQQLRDEARVDSRRAIVMVTDNHGLEGAPARATRDMLWRTDTILCGLLVKGGTAAENGSDVRPFIRATGGETFEIGGGGSALTDAFRSLRERYLLTFRATAGEKKTIHTISVDLAPQARSQHPDAVVLVRGGYVVGEEGERPPISSIVQ